MILSIFLTLSIFGVTAPADSWECRNDLEIRCQSGNCKSEAKDGFTPMSVSFDDSGMMSVCAYSGCWEGTGKVFKSGNFTMLTGNSLKFSTSPDRTQNVVIALDQSDNVATLKAGTFAHPLICKKKVAKKRNTPTFEQHKAPVSNATPKAIKFKKNKQARMFRTRLNESMQGGVNFAGNFIFAYWGCGTGCAQGAIINTKKGTVYFPDELAGMGFGIAGAQVSDKPLQFRKDSKLLILSGYAGNGEKNGIGTTYLVWEGTKFRQAKFISAK